MAPPSAGRRSATAEYINGPPTPSMGMEAFVDKLSIVIYQLKGVNLWRTFGPICHRAGKDNGMLVNGIINPAINSLLSRVHHTDTLIVTDRGFPYIAGVETIDISLVAGIPRVVDVLRAIRMNFNCGKGVMATEFREVSSTETLRSY